MSVCRAALNIKGAPYQCDQEAPHTGWAHSNKEAEAIWCSHGEAISAQKKLKQTLEQGQHQLREGREPVALEELEAARE